MLITIKQLLSASNMPQSLAYFTFTLLSLSFIFHLLDLFTNSRFSQSKLLNEIHVIARWLLWLAGLFSLVTSLFLISTSYIISQNKINHYLIPLHTNFAIITLILIILSTGLSIFIYRKDSKHNYILLISLLISQISVLTTIYLTINIKNTVLTTEQSFKPLNKNKSTQKPVNHNINNMDDMDMSPMDMNNEHQAHTQNIKEQTQQKTAINQIPLYWIDPMEPSVHYAKSGKSAMGMELVPVYHKANDDNQPKNSIKLSQAYIDNLGVVTAPVVNANLANQINTYAYVESDENKIAYITSYTNGWVRKLVVKSSGVYVKKGQLLAQIYSPTIINAEQEYLMAIQSENKLLANAALKKLTSFHVAEDQIKQLQKTKNINQLMNIYASQNGIVAELNIREGDYITPESKLFSIVDLSSVWLIAAVFEKQTQWLKLGNAAVATFAAYPNKSWSGRVEYIYPQLDAQTRTLKARLRFDNHNLLLKPNMYGNITIATSPQIGKLTIPEEAVIRDTNSNRVIVALGNGVFQVRKVTTGDETNGQIEITSGLHLGESVVKSGEFMLDSEANLNAAVDKLDSSGAQHD